jgi:hypothetical protein
MPMLRPEELIWTTRAEVCAQLAEFLLRTPPAPRSVREQAPETEYERIRWVTLLAQLGDHSSVPALRHLRRDHRESRWVHAEALYGLCRLGAVLPTEELRQILEDRSVWDPCYAEPCTAHVYIDRLPALFRSPEAKQLARKTFEGWPPRTRAELLLSLLYAIEAGGYIVQRQEEVDGEAPGYEEVVNIDPIALEWVDWLYDRWLNLDRLTLERARLDGRPLNLQVMTATRKRPASRALLIERWRRARGSQRRELLLSLCGDEDEGIPGECVGDNPADWKELAETLVLSPADLHNYFGSEQLLLKIEEKIRTADRETRAERGSSLCPWSTHFQRLMYLLERWPDADTAYRLDALFLCPDLHPDLRQQLFYALGNRRRDRIGPMALALTSQAEDQSLLQHVLRWMAGDPRAADREFLYWAIGQTDKPEFRYLALQVLERLGEDSAEWRLRLEELVRDKAPLVRIEATAVLVRRGEEHLLPSLVREATDAEEVCVRAEALRILGELDAGRHAGLLRRALFEDHGAIDGPYGPSAPAVEEAALVLIELGTPEALTAVIRSYLAVSEWVVCSALERCLEALSARLDGREEPIELIDYIGRRRDCHWKQERSVASMD